VVGWACGGGGNGSFWHVLAGYGEGGEIDMVRGTGGVVEVLAMSIQRVVLVVSCRVMLCETVGGVPCCALKIAGDVPALQCCDSVEIKCTGLFY